MKVFQTMIPHYNGSALRIAPGTHKRKKAGGRVDKLDLFSLSYAFFVTLFLISMGVLACNSQYWLVGLLGDEFDTAKDVFKVALPADIGEHSSPEGLLHYRRHEISRPETNEGRSGLLAGRAADDPGGCAGNGVVGTEADRFVG